MEPPLDVQAPGSPLPGASAPTGDGPARPPPAPPAGLDEWLTDLGALLGEVRTLVRVRLERTRLSLRQRGLQLALFLLGMLAAGTATLLGVRLVVRGIAGGCVQLLAGRPWAGELLAGIVTLGGLGGLAWLALAASNRAELRRLRQKFEDPTQEGEAHGPAPDDEPTAGRRTHAPGVPGAARG